ncbi:hypothetical protein [Lampropedia hyalina]|jgi:hypothetical protein|nr:hypothetical protein [Lampropedia hyalina]
MDAVAELKEQLAGRRKKILLKRSPELLEASGNALFVPPAKEFLHGQ